MYIIYSMCETCRQNTKLMDEATEVISVKVIIVEETVGDSVKPALPVFTWFSLPFCPV